MKRDRERVPVDEFLCKFPGADLLFEVFKDKILIEKEILDGREYYWLTIETKFTMQYNVRVNVCDDGSVYFGGWSTDRLMRPFEDWNRGNDLADGKLGKRTIIRFLRDIVDDLFVNAPKQGEKEPYQALPGEITKETAISEK